MSPGQIDTVLAAGSLALFAVAYAAVLVSSRPAPVRPQAATPDLGDEPPAVVNLLANRWRLTEDAGEATLLDLAARGYLELRQPGSDPRQATIHLRQRAQKETLTPYERRVLDRVTTLAVDGVVPVSALAFRDKRRARRWNQRLREEVVADARSRGVSRRRVNPAALTALLSVAAVSAGGVGLAVLRVAWRDDNTEVAASYWSGAVVFSLLALVAMRPLGESDTPTGREVAARWLGVRDWLRGHDEFADLPPAAVTVWDRYLPYGAALGVTHVASEVLDLGMGSRRQVWSSYGGRWRRVRVRYPRFWPRYGSSAPALLARAGVALVVGLIWLARFGAPRPELPAAPQDPAGAVAAARWTVSVLAVLAAGYGGYVLLRSLLDLLTTRTLTGEVLWLERWRSTRGRGGRTVPYLSYLVVDDGTADRATAWALPGSVTPALLLERDVVTVRVRPWSRRVVHLVVVERGRTHDLTDAPVRPADPGPTGHLQHVVDTVAATLGGPGALAESLLTADDVALALGMQVEGPRRVAVPGLLGGATFATTGRSRMVLMVGVSSGRAGVRALRRVAAGTPVPGIGDDAYLRRDQAAARVGTETVILTLFGPGRPHRQRLPLLLERAVTRIPYHREPA